MEYLFAKPSFGRRAFGEPEVEVLDVEEHTGASEPDGKIGKGLAGRNFVPGNGHNLGKWRTAFKPGKHGQQCFIVALDKGFH